MQSPLLKQNKMEASATSTSATPSPSSSCGCPSALQQSPVQVINYRCKQKQYHSVLWTLQLMLALLRHLPETGAGSLKNKAETHQSTVVQRFLAAAEGANASFDVEGPLSATQLLSLQHSFTDDEVRELCVECLSAFVRQQRPRGAPAQPITHATVFAAPTALMQTLWPTPHFRAQYATALAEAHRHRINHSDFLAMPGYLQEAGLHAERVLTGQMTATGSSAFTDPEELRASEEWRRLIRDYTAFLPDRSHIHELENLPQEVAIGELLCDTVASVQRATAAAPEGSAGAAFALDCVVDVGGGNGFLAAQVAERLHCDGAVIDPFFPAHSIDCCPRVWPDTPHRRHAAMRRRQTLHRTKALFRDVRWADVVPAAPSRSALIAKHLCGSGVDEVLTRLEAQGCLPRILVLAPCCFNKITFNTYCNPAYLRETMGIESEGALARVHRLTDWNMSCYQSTQEAVLAAAEAQRRGRKGARHVETTMLDEGVSRAFSYQRRSGPRSIVNSIICTHAFALLVEGLLNYGRMAWLRSRDYEVRLVQYVPDVVTPKNKCLLAIRR